MYLKDKARQAFGLCRDYPFKALAVAVALLGLGLFVGMFVTRNPVGWILYGFGMASLALALGLWIYDDKWQEKRLRELERTDPIGAAIERGDRITMILPDETLDSFYLDAFFRLRGGYGNIRVVEAKKNPRGWKTGDRHPDGSIVLMIYELPGCPNERFIYCTGYGDRGCVCSLWDKWPSIRLAFLAAKASGDDEMAREISKTGDKYQLAMASGDYSEMHRLEAEHPELFTEPIAA